MSGIEIIFWASVICVIYTYVIYPLAIAVAARFFGRPVRRSPFTGTLTIVVSAFNEAHRIASRRDELLRLIDASGLQGNLIIVSDGSSDRTAEVAAMGSDLRVRVIDLKTNVGKAAALTIACAAADGDVIVFADSRQRWADDAITLLLDNLGDPKIGGVSGDLVLQSAEGSAASSGVYWRYEKWIRHNEGVFQSTVGVTGAISAVRRHLFTPIPTGTVLDDVYWPLCVCIQGFRVVHDQRARAFDRLPDKAADEMRRKIRTLSGNFQLFWRLPESLIPFKNPIFLQVFSHKVLRLMTPWALLAILACSILLLRQPIFRAFLLAQLLFYLLALAGSNRAIAGRLRAASAATSFVLLSAAAWFAFWIWLFGRTNRSWHKVKYDIPPAA